MLSGNIILKESDKLSRFGAEEVKIQECNTSLTYH